MSIFKIIGKMCISDYTQDKKRPKFIDKLYVLKIKTILFCVFNNGDSFFSYLTRIDGTYTPLNFKETVSVEKRSTTLNPLHYKASRVKSYFNNKIEIFLKLRLGGYKLIIQGILYYGLVSEYFLTLW